MGALMPHDEVFDEDVYEFKEEPNEKGTHEFYCIEDKHIRWIHRYFIHIKKSRYNVYYILEILLLYNIEKLIDSPFIYSQELYVSKATAAGEFATSYRN